MDQLTVINTHSENWQTVLEHDPVRPHISHWARVAANRECFAIHDGILIRSVLCAAYIGKVPEVEDEVFAEYSTFNVVCFYSVWSFAKGAGSKIINRAMNHIMWNKPKVTRAVTFSPKTDMAKNFHLANGAKLYRENVDSYNFEYNI